MNQDQNSTSRNFSDWNFLVLPKRETRNEKMLTLRTISFSLSWVMSFCRDTTKFSISKNEDQFEIVNDNDWEPLVGIKNGKIGSNIICDLFEFYGILSLLLPTVTSVPWALSLSSPINKNNKNKFWLTFSNSFFISIKTQIVPFSFITSAKWILYLACVEKILSF